MTTFLDAAWATDKDKPLEHQDKAWAYAWGILSKEQQTEFLKQFRNSANTVTKLNNLLAVQHMSQPALAVQYMSQRDNYRDAFRTCFSSSCAMLLKFLKPGSIKTDDDYIKAVFNIGDTTEGSTQVSALKHFGLPATFVTTGNRDLVKKQINSGKPVPAGFLHHGTPSQPAGGGHWLCIIGYDETGYWVNDPWGECDLLTGTYPSTDGAKKHYSYKNFEPRWMADGPSTGWCIVA
jgi:uncharacterized protein YvpB